MKFILKILCAPVIAVLAITVWLLSALLYCSSYVLGFVSVLGTILALFVLITTSVTNGVILLVLAFLVSPMGLPMIAVHIVGLIQKLRYAIQDMCW